MIEAQHTCLCRSIVESLPNPGGLSRALDSGRLLVHDGGRVTADLAWRDLSQRPDVQTRRFPVPHAREGRTWH